MGNVWKIGSRWSEYGTQDSSILSVFRRNNIVFVGEANATQRFLNEVAKNDYFAIADGYSVVAVAKVLDSPKYLKDFKLDITDYESDVFDYEDCKDWAVGVRVKIIDLEEPIWYENRGAFSAANQIWETVIDLYENQSNRFVIYSNTATLFKGRKQDTIKSLFDNHTRYIVPVYQRPYSWGEEEVTLFLNDLIKSFWGDDGDNSLSEPMFIGTMQLSYPKIIDKNEYWQEIIDGQQRITTLTIILKELSLLYPNCDRIKDLNFDWLETQINETQSRYLFEYLSLQSTDDVISDNNNHYYKNAALIRDLIKGVFDRGDNEYLNDNGAGIINKFVDYIFHDIFFVVIETRAGLSKTLKIFNTINTSGLDLNGGDLFKIRMYEYLVDVENEDKKAFDKINAIYQKIDDLNYKYDKTNNDGPIITIDEILKYYKDILIAKYDLPNVLFTYDWTTFYDRLFDTLLNVKKWENFNKVLSSDFKLSLDEIQKLIDISSEWNILPWTSGKLENCNPKELMFAYNLISCTRYRGYGDIVYLILFKHNRAQNKYKILSDLLVEITKVLFIYSIGYARSVYEIHSFMQIIQKKIMTSSHEDVWSKIKEQLNKSKEWAKTDLSKQIVDKYVWKNLICITSEFLAMKNRRSISVIERLLFETDYDIEHIHANADTKEWENDELQNSIGNLCMLESDINRSISNKSFKDKKQSKKNDGMDYLHSQYVTVKTLAKNNDKWTENDALKRRERETNRIIKYLFEDDD